MNYILCVIHDRSINAYINLHCVRAEGQAIRQFQDAINDQATGGGIHKHPDDYDLYRVGVYCDDDGSIQVEKPTKLADGKQLALTAD